MAIFNGVVSLQEGSIVASQDPFLVEDVGTLWKFPKLGSRWHPPVVTDVTDVTDPP